MTTDHDPTVATNGGTQQNGDVTKVFYYIDDEKTPYILRFGRSPSTLTLGEFKAALPHTKYKFFFETVDKEFKLTVKEELQDDNCPLPRDENDRIVCYVSMKRCEL